MDDLKLPESYKAVIKGFEQGLKDIYREKLVSLILYGSAVSGEFVDKHSSLNLLVILENTDLETIRKSSGLIAKFKKVDAIFLTEDYIAGSLDVFPIEFLDMRENYFLVYGKDVLKDIAVDMRNLRFQCEHELKQKLIRLKHLYLKLGKDPAALRSLLLASFTSVLHVARNLLRLKGVTPPYLKQDVIKALASDFKINGDVWDEILCAKTKRERLSPQKADELFTSFTKELETLVDILDA